LKAAISVDTDSTSQFVVAGGLTARLSSFNDQELAGIEANIKKEVEATADAEVSMVTLLEIVALSGSRSRREGIDLTVIITWASISSVSDLVVAKDAIEAAIAADQFSFDYSYDDSIFTVTSSDISSVSLEPAVPEICVDYCTAHDMEPSKHGKSHKSKKKVKHMHVKKLKKVRQVKSKSSKEGKGSKFGAKHGKSMAADIFADAQEDLTRCVNFCSGGARTAKTKKADKKTKKKGKKR
jgi:hypothetical protein